MVGVQNIEEYQLLLNKLPGIISSKIIVNEMGNLTEIHILSDISRSPKQIVRDIQSALLANYNLQVDHKIVSIAQVEDDQIGVQDFRLSIDSIQMYSRQSKVEASVILKKGELLYEGTSIGGNSPLGRLRIVADATLKAVHQFCKEEFLFVLSDVLPITLANRKVITVSVLHFLDKGDEHLSGSAFINSDENEAVVKATLDAINRRLSFYGK